MVYSVDGLLVLFQSSVVLMLELILKVGDFTAQSKIELFTHTCFFGSKSGAFHLSQFNFHFRTHFLFESIEGEFVLNCKVVGNGILHGCNTL